MCVQAVMFPNPLTVITSRPPEATTPALNIHLPRARLPAPSMRPSLPPLQRMEPATLHRRSTPFPAVPATLHLQSTLSLMEPATHPPQSTLFPAESATRHRQPTLSLMELATRLPQSIPFPVEPVTRHRQSTPSLLEPHTAQAQAPMWRLCHHPAIMSEPVRALQRHQVAPVQNTFPSQLDTTTKSRAVLSVPRCLGGGGGPIIKRGILRWRNLEIEWEWGAHSTAFF